VSVAVAAETVAARHGHTVPNLAAAEAAGIQLLTPEHETLWPHRQFADLAAMARHRGEFAPPVALWARGTAALPYLCDRAVAVIGTRVASHYGAHVSSELAIGLARAALVVVGGAAVGVETAALRGALAAGGQTLAVLAAGIDVAHPSQNPQLLEQVARTGLVVSEYGPGTLPNRDASLARWRILAALVDAVVVPEAELWSAALCGTERAAVLGRRLLAVPGPVTSGLSAGCHRLLQGSAEVALSADDVRVAAELHRADARRRYDPEAR
jgi:DNA processing protein